MNEAAACTAAGPIALDEALRRFDREAACGVCDTGRYRCPYYTWGHGPPLLCIPGLSDDAQSFVMFAALLSPHFRCIAYNLPDGRGDGARLGRYTHGELAADAVALLDHVGAKQSYVLGCSFGSTIALAALHRSPERFPRAVLQGGFARRPLAPAELLLASLARYWPGSLRHMPLRPKLLWHAHHGPFASRPPEVWKFFLTRWGLPSIAAAAQRGLMVHRLDLRLILPEIRQPVLLVCGDCDPLVNQRCEEELLHGLPSAGRLELSGCGHNPLFTHPEQLADVVRGFFTPPGDEPKCPFGTTQGGTL